MTAGGVAVAVALSASPALAAVMMQTGGGPERGIDVSAYQNANGPIDWRELARQGIKFVAIKAAEGTYYTFGRGRMIAWIAGFASRARALTGSWPIIYTTVSWWQECSGSTGRFTRDPLWLADYNGGRPAAPPAWARWSFWQYSEEGYVPGIGWTDLDYFQSASGLPSLHPATEPKARHRQKPRSKHQSKYKKPKPEQKHKQKKISERIGKARHLSISNHQFPAHPHQNG